MNRTFTDLINHLGGENNENFLIWTENDLFPILDKPARIDFMGIFIPLSGTMIDEINLESARLDTQHIQVFTHSYIVKILKRSKDFRCVGILFSRKYWEKVLFESHSLNTITRLMPCLKINNEQRKHLLDYYNLIASCKAKSINNEHNEIIKHLIIGMFIELGNIYKQQKKENNINTEQERLLKNFLELIYENYKENREVSFYAEKLSLSQRYFTTVIKKISGYSALRWIEKYVVLEAQLLLKTSDLKVKEIAAQLNFDDVSFFCKYFKRVAGVSPNEYRKM